MSSSPYAPAAQMLSQIWSQRKSIKTLAYDKKGSLRCSKATYAQVCHVLESKHLLDAVLEQVEGFESVRNEGLLYILLYELLLGPNLKIRGGGALKRQLMSNESALRTALQQVQGSSDAVAPSVVSFPRYVRINTLQTDAQEVIASLSPQHKQVYMDAHVPNLLVLPPATSLHEHELVRTGKVVLQDKSSCFSALCLVHGNEEPLDGDYMDACAAPGNKTSHLAALIGELPSSKTSTVHALDRSSTRLASLQRRMDQLVPAKHRNVRVIPEHLDFLKTNPAQYSKVRAILLDPSCSGSGIFTSPDRLDGHDQDEARMTSLSNFQLVALKHAMSFPKVTRIVYSTCSLLDIENEHVVGQALQANPDWQLVAPACLQGWKRRGHVVGGLSSSQASCLIRADRGDDTNGFFVAYLERKGGATSDTVLRRTRKNVVPKGISVYNGEFSVTEDPEPSDCKMETAPESQVAQVPKKVRSESSAAADFSDKKAIGKKRAKRLAWKRKQMEQKVWRIEKKKAHTSTDEAMASE